jgi:PTH1 family peptidyl-tRNA hydrolase
MGLFSKAVVDPDRWVIAGLGNPGSEYAETRHNAGAMVVHLLADRMGERFRSHKSGCMVAEGRLAGTKVALARPMSYMNLSGRPIRLLMDFYKVPVERLLVVHDEMDIEFGEVRIKNGGGTAGHNGLKSVSSHLATKDFTRVRVGVGRPRNDAVDHVLDRFSGSERKQLEDLLADAADAVEAVIGDGLERAMTEVNDRRRR